MGQLVDHYRLQHPLAFNQLESMIEDLGKLTVLLNEECHNAMVEIQVHNLLVRQGRISFIAQLALNIHACCEVELEGFLGSASAPCKQLLPCAGRCGQKDSYSAKRGSSAEG